MSRIVLASASPRRKELLEQIGLEFEICPAKGEEVITAGSVDGAVLELSSQKAEEVAAGILSYNEIHPELVTPQDILVIGADTVVACDGNILGKPRDEADAVTPEQMVALINELREEFDYILLDCPAGIEQGFKNAVAGADRALVVTTPEVSAIRDADRIVGLLEANEMKKIDLIVNRLRVDMVKRGEMMTVDDVTDILAVNLIGAVPDDEQIVISTNRGEPLVGTNCLAGKAYSNICHRIMGEEVPFLNLNEKQGVLEKLKDIFKKN